MRKLVDKHVSSDASQASGRIEERVRLKKQETAYTTITSNNNLLLIYVPLLLELIN